MAQRPTWREVLDRFHPAGLLYSTYEHRVLAEIKPEQRPRHVAVMADGNRRWARANAPGEPLEVGYRAGARRLVEFCEWCDEAQIQVVTLWVLSTENITRDAAEVGPLLEVIVDLADELAVHRDWQVHCVGALDLLPDGAADRLRSAAERTDGETGMVVNIAVSYGGRQELRDAVRSLLAEHAERGTSLTELADELEIEHIASHLYTAGQPDPDLVIRTSGEQRIGGFLLWQSVHSEFYFCDALWPDFRKVDFIRALRSFAQRERRYGR
ncbi:MAG TPA: isoprenyl transferase [Candidatus Avipropionibacterium avicola]|uniref:Isoprenyl transferase n=1 Tax=Candidatus Avipropionibacterium avicola TaxID=2840701 RepID=A0A9D1GXM8_9ACTN|nr:isoprenyl transferase [Candidatus Avipropionibacterium avicola]